MYKLLPILLLLSIISCQDEVKEKNIVKNELVLKESPKQDSTLGMKKDTILILKKDSILTIKHKITTIDGVWLNEIYYNALITSKSPKKSQLIVRNSVVVIPKRVGKDVFIGMNFHEGMRYELEKDSLSYYIETGYNSSVRENIKLKNNTLTVREDKYVKIKSIRNKHHRFFNIAEQLIFTGRYNWNGRQVQFTEQGKVIGLDSLKNYLVILDYIEPGHGTDQLWLGTNQDSFSTYGFQFLGDTLEIYSLMCNDINCYYPKFDKRLYQLVKEN